MKLKFNAFSIILLIIVVIGVVEKTFQNDTFYIIKTGESIVHNGIDMIDHFSFHNIAYPYEHWLYNLIIYGVYFLGGFRGVYYFTVFLTIILALLLYFFNYNLTKNELLSLLITIISVTFCYGFFAARAQLMSCIIFVCEIFCIEKLLKKGKTIYMILLVILSWLCANVHAAVWPMFFVLLCPYIATNVVCAYRDKEINISKLHIYKQSGTLFFGRSKKNSFKDVIIFSKYNNYKKLLITLLLCLFVGLLVPNHFQPFTYFFKVMQGNTMNWIAEHQATMVFNNKNYLLTLVVTIFCFVFLKVKIYLKDFIFLSGLMLMSLMANRHVALFILLGSFSICEIFNNYIQKYHGSLHNLFVKVLSKPAMMIFTISVATFCSSYIYVKKISAQKFVSDTYPIKAAKYINNNIDKKSMRLFNDYNYGSYLLYKDIPVFIDSRAALYTKPFSGLERDIADDWYQVSSTGKYKKIFKYYKITHVITEKDSILEKTLKLDSNYSIIYSDKRYVLFAKKE